MTERGFITDALTGGHGFWLGKCAQCNGDENDHPVFRKDNAGNETLVCEKFEAQAKPEWGPDLLSLADELAEAARKLCSRAAIQHEEDETLDARLAVQEKLAAWDAARKGK